jgi:hypothetical protein
VHLSPDDDLDQHVPPQVLSPVFAQSAPVAAQN